MSEADRGKQAAGQAAAERITSGMIVGLGTGSTATHFLRALGTRVRSGLTIQGIPTSEASADLARTEGIPLTTLEDHPVVDVDVDGADAIDPALGLVKGLGGALLREKIVAAAAKRFIVIAGEDKLVGHLREAPVVPVEVVRFGWTSTRRWLEKLGATATRRLQKGSMTEPFVTDGGNYILDCALGAYENAGVIAERIRGIPGVVEHGFFLGMAQTCLLGRADGSVKTIER